ncbi:MAG: asparagine synthase (glutamine-hydrolyzing), partial [Alphaproteobacteria bacterium]|nr:asparagine synthase (glutamine-hydrolyzing) [Alphaproteobacteria bacterium]
LQKMTSCLAHRGPDADGHWDDAQQEGAGIFLGHRRLSILDLSPAGAQPMISQNGRYVLVFNGEIYNFKNLLAHLPKDLSLRGRSDTEVLLEHFSHCGVSETLEHIKGMFALALWDRRERTLTLARDHIGKKPLYAGWIDGCLIFASELKALQAFASSSLEIDREALEQFNYFGFIPAPRSIYKNVSKISPGSVVTLHESDLRSKNTKIITEKMTRYWRVKKGSNDKKQKPFKEIISEAVALRMISDVPLGSFLSGGIDSSLVTALMQEQSTRPVKTYSIGFTDEAFDESLIAEKIAAHLGTDHTTYRVKEADALGVIQDLPQIYDEPFADYSQIPTLVLCAQARKDTIVALSGDGGDEVFCGYKRYFMLKKLLAAARFMPRRQVASLLERIGQSGYKRIGLNGKRMHAIAGYLQDETLDEAILRSLAANPDAPRPILGLDLEEGLNAFECMMMIDTNVYLPDDILVKVDRASMAASLEVRSPLLDKDVIEYAWSIPIEEKVFKGQGKGKKPLYELLCQYVPEELINRPKQGFTPPIARWLRGDLRSWAEDILAADTGLYEKAEMRKLWEAFITGRADTHTALWAVLMAQSWALHNKPASARNAA